MNGPASKDSAFRSILVVVLTALLASGLVSLAVVVLRPIQHDNQLLDRSRNVLQLTGLLPPGAKPSGSELRAYLQQLDIRTVDLEDGRFAPPVDLGPGEEHTAAGQSGQNIAIPPDRDIARLGERPRYVTAYLVWHEGVLARIILPINGNGMWSMLYGYIALESDLNTIADAIFYEHGETPGLGDQITRVDWLAQWRGRKLFDDSGALRFAVAGSRVDPESTAAQYEVDALSGATVTADAVTALMHYWFGPHGYQQMLNNLRQQPPAPPAGQRERQ